MEYETLDELIMSWWDSLTEEIQDEIREFYGDVDLRRSND